jgi:hypothetical protein
MLNEFLNEIKNVEEIFLKNGDIGARNKALLNTFKLIVMMIQGNFKDFEVLAHETFNLAVVCYFDMQIDQVLTGILNTTFLGIKNLNHLLSYLKKSSNEKSEEISKELIIHFNTNDCLFTLGKEFFKDIGKEYYFTFLSHAENKDYSKILEFLNKCSSHYTESFINTLIDMPDLRINLINKLSERTDLQKEKLLLLYYYDENNLEEAFEIIKNLDLSKLNYFECKPILQILLVKEAWDFQIIVLKILLEKEKNQEIIINLKLKLFIAYQKLNKHLDVINLGENLLKEDLNLNKINQHNKKFLLKDTIFSCLKRGEQEYQKAKKILCDYPLHEPFFEFKLDVESEVYLKNNEYDGALKSIIEGIKIKKFLSAYEYAYLYFKLSILGSKTNLTLDSLKNVKENNFVKLKNKDEWYYIGNDNELDAIPISNTNYKYSLFISKNKSDKINFGNKYNSNDKEQVIELIFSVEQYVLWQSVQNFHNLSKDNDLKGVVVIDMPLQENTLDPKNLINFLKDEQQKKEPFFELYCKNKAPIAMLALNEGNLANAVGRIRQEAKGFVYFCNGDFEKQTQIAIKIVSEKQPFYIDGTSAFFLSESGLLQKIHTFLPNLKVPQSVINFIADIASKFNDVPNHAGYMSFNQGKINFSTIDEHQKKLIRLNLIECIKILESKPNNIGNISSANKVNCFFEKELQNELCDACILAQKETLPIMTEDYLYLLMNAQQTNKKVPEYFSSLALVRCLYEDKKIKFEDYLAYFYYLSTYRLSFLRLSSDDIEKAIFGDEPLRICVPENIRKLNLSLTLSEEYGVPFKSAFNVLGIFLLKIIQDDSVTIEILEKIFFEILNSLPIKINKKYFEKVLVSECEKAIRKTPSKSIILPNDLLIQSKLEKLKILVGD